VGKLDQVAHTVLVFDPIYRLGLPPNHTVFAKGKPFFVLKSKAFGAAG
jgi:hypothetical protein